MTMMRLTVSIESFATAAAVGKKGKEKLKTKQNKSVLLQ
jgi:hypothetical protein